MPLESDELPVDNRLFVGAARWFTTAPLVDTPEPRSRQGRLVLGFLENVKLKLIDVRVDLCLLIPTPTGVSFRPEPEDFIWSNERQTRVAQV